MVKAMKISTTILTLRFLIVCTIIGATLGNSLANKNQTSHTVHPISPFHPQDDTDLLYSAVNGYRENTKLIIHILAHRCESQRLKIVRKFYNRYRVTLEDEIKSRFGENDFTKAIKALLTPLNVYYAKELYRAMEKKTIAENTHISDILVPLTIDEIETIDEIYKKEFGLGLLYEVKRVTSGYYMEFLVSLLSIRRDKDHDYSDYKLANEDVKMLYKAGKLIWGTDESTFNEILTKRSYTQLREIFRIYEKNYGVSFEDVIGSEFSGAVEDAYLAVVDYARNKTTYFAKRLHTALAGLGTENITLTRIIVTRSEIDLGDIQKAYREIYGNSLASDIEDDTSEDYRLLLLALVGQ